MRDYEEILACGKISVLKAKRFDENTFRIKCYLFDPVTGKRWLAYATKGMGWEHVSVGSETKTPGWDTMCLAKDVFFRKDECCVQYHPKEEDYVNMHEHTLHIWKPEEGEIPCPPSILVGFKGVSQEQVKAVSALFLSGMNKEETLAMAERHGIKTNRRFRRAMK